jgi:predicted nucleic acid-binding protein
VDLIVDASALVGELLRRRGRRILTHPEIDLYMASPQWDEAMHELTRRVRHVAERLGLDAEELLKEAQALAEATIEAVPEEIYAALEEEAGKRVEDPDDVPTVALAWAFGADVWTYDQDFFGSGVATCTT